VKDQTAAGRSKAAALTATAREKAIVLHEQQQREGQGTQSALLRGSTLLRKVTTTYNRNQLEHPYNKKKSSPPGGLQRQHLSSSNHLFFFITSSHTMTSVMKLSVG